MKLQLSWFACRMSRRTKRYVVCWVTCKWTVASSRFFKFGPETKGTSGWTWIYGFLLTVTLQLECIIACKKHQLNIFPSNLQQKNFLLIFHIILYPINTAVMVGTCCDGPSFYAVIHLSHLTFLIPFNHQPNNIWQFNDNLRIIFKCHAKDI